MKSLSIVKKVWFSLGILILGYLVSMVTGFYLGFKTETRMMIASDSIFPATMYSYQAVTSFNEQIKGYNDAVLMGEDSIFDITLEKSKVARESLAMIIQMHGIDPESKKAMNQTQTLLAEFTKDAQVYYEMISQGDTEIDEAKMITLASQTNQIQGQLAQHRDSLSLDLKTTLEGINKASKNQRKMNLWLFIGVVSFAMVCTWLIITRAISLPIANTIKMLRDIAEGEGDLTKRLDIKSNDEIGEVSKWFNIFIEKLQVIIGDFSQNAGTLNTASDQLVGLSGQMSNESADMSSHAKEVSESAEEMSVTLSNVAAAMEQTSVNTSMVASAAEQMNSTIHDIAQNSDHVRTISSAAVLQAEDTTKKMKKLDGVVKDIGKVTETITDISEQINLLALNATIEAARAGEAGRGFSVVANEIKDLAKQTASSSADIKSQIETVQETTESTFKDIYRTTEVINTINENISAIANAVDEQSHATRNIADNIAQASQGIQEVNENVNQSSIAANEITETISQVDISSNEISGGSEKVNGKALNLKEMADKLHEIVGKFKI